MSRLETKVLAEMRTRPETQRRWPKTRRTMEPPRALERRTRMRPARDEDEGALERRTRMRSARDEDEDEGATVR